MTQTRLRKLLRPDGRTRLLLVLYGVLALGATSGNVSAQEGTEFPSPSKPSVIDDASGTRRRIHDSTLEANSGAVLDYDFPQPARSTETDVITASTLQPTPLAIPRSDPTLGATPSTPGTTLASAPVSNLLQELAAPTFGSKDKVVGSESLTQASRDLGDLLKKTNTAPSVSVQSRSPITNDPRIRGSRIGSLAASGSYWLPTRVDLDSVLSKFDSRQVSAATITPGPFTSRLGPGFNFADIELRSSPRFQEGFEVHGATDVDYHSNGNQVFGQQSFSMGGESWGASGSYGYRSGDDYFTGAGSRVPSSYDSQTMTLALGRDWEHGSIEFDMLRLDQNDVEFPGYVFDIDDLVSDGYELTYTHKESPFFDTIESQAWYNRTHFDGNAQNTAKRPFFPVLDLLNYRARTDVDLTSIGYRQEFVHAQLEGSGLFRLGHDLRFVDQELNEISSGTNLGLPLPFTDRNSPIPKSYATNPGLFAEYELPVMDSLLWKAGGRADYAFSDVTDTAAKLSSVGLSTIPPSYFEVVGSRELARNFTLLSTYSTLENRDGDWHETLSLGYAERAPNLTELYAAQPFIMLIQNGLNNTTGDPGLKKEKLLQFDTGLEFRNDALLIGARGFQMWVFDYITFENTLTTLVPPAGNVGQVSLRYVNTDLATISGFETFSELDPTGPITPFANVKYVRGTDQTRNGKFATTNGESGDPSRKIAGMKRGFFSGVTGDASEPLPGIAPLEARVGIRLRSRSDSKRWQLEIASRIVDSQSRVATSLFESVTPGFTVWDVRSVIQPTRSDNWQVSCGIENLGDRLYREHLDFRSSNGLAVYQPGISAYLGSSLIY